MSWGGVVLFVGAVLAGCAFIVGAAMAVAYGIQRWEER